ncbi:MAG TPA: AAA family ATPase [Pseudomonadota bacterium]|nr:AAA family ATPase [Pseudomonadota bacterium]
MSGPQSPPAHEVERQLAEQWLNAELNRIWLVAERCLRQYQRAQLRPLPDNPALAEIEGIFTARRSARGTNSTGPLDELEIGQSLTDAEAVVQSLRRTAPIGRMAENLRLTPLEVETLVVSLAPHIDAPLSDVFTLLRGSPARRGVDLALVAQLYQLKRSERLSLLDAIDPERPLLLWRMIQVLPPDSIESYSSMNYRALMPTFDVLSVLTGRGDLAPALARCAELRRSEANLSGLALDEAVAMRISKICDSAAHARSLGHISQMPWLLLYGQRGVGKREAATRIAAYAGRQLLTFDPNRVEQGTLDDLLRRAQREALLRGALLYIGPLRADLLAENAKELMKRITDYPSQIILGVESSTPPRLKLERSLQEVELSLPSEPTRRKIWEIALPAARRGSDLAIDSLARAFHLTAGEIHETGREAVELAELNQTGVISHDEVRRGIDRRLRNELGDMARRIQVVAKWEDLVLPAEDTDRIREFIGRSKHATRVYADWGFGQRLGYGKGMIALFSGPPGTGKTMLAGIIAQELDLDIYQVDLAQVVSKWVGETEKQLSRVFDQAERAHAVLLFDEADSLFAKRTEVKTSNDRYGNLAVNYLLQRLEHYSGVVVMTTNKEASLDEALQRRLTLHLHLQIPEPPERERLWRSMLPTKAPSARNINFRALANDYEISGGYIKNVALRAAFLAAQEGISIHMGLLRRAAALELEDMGRLVARSGRKDVAGLPDAAPGPESEPRSGNDFSE